MNNLNNWAVDEPDWRLRSKGVGEGIPLVGGGLTEREESDISIEA
jgi:hypothetical protein